MRFTHGYLRTKALSLVAAAVAFAAQVVLAGAIDVSIDTSKLGVTPNEDCGIGGICGAVSSINSFTYLSRKYPSIYGDDLLPDYNATTNTDSSDAKKFAVDGWQEGTNPNRTGYYNRTGGAELDFLNTKKDWFHDFALDTTVFNSWWTQPAGHPEWASPDNNNSPTIADLAAEIQHGEDVEFFVQDGDFYHVMTLTGIVCDEDMNCSIKYQDPNDPAQDSPNETMAKIYMADVTIMDGMITFEDVPGSGHTGTVKITAAFAESPIPEPATAVIIVLGACGLLGCGRQRVC